MNFQESEKTFLSQQIECYYTVLSFYNWNIYSELRGKGITYLMLRGFVSAASKGVKVTRFSLRVFVADL